MWCSFLSKSDSSRKELVMSCFLAHYSNVPLAEGGGGDGRREAHCTSTVARTNWTKQHSLMFCRAAYLMSPRGDFAFLKLLLILLIIQSLASSYNTTPSAPKSPYSPIQNPRHFSVIFVPPSPVYLCHILSVIGHFCINDIN